MEMLSSAWFLTRRRDCLHQTPIEAQPPPGRRCEAVAPRPRNISVPSSRTIQSAGSRSVDRVQLCGRPGGGAEQSSSIARNPDVCKTPISDPYSPAGPVAGPVEPVGGARRASVQGAVGSAAHALSIAPAGSIGQGQVDQSSASWPKTERERVSNPRRGLPGSVPMDLGRALRRTDLPNRKVLRGSALWAPVRRRAHPLSSLNRDKAFQVEGLLAQQHVVGSAAELGRQDTQGFALAVLFLDPAEVLAPWRVPAQEQGGGFGEGPLEMDVAHLATCRLLDLVVGFMPSLDQPSVGQEVLDAGKALQVVDLVEQSQSQDLADSWNGAQQGELVSVVLSDLVKHEQLEIADNLVVGSHQGDVGGHGHLDAAVVEVLDDGSAVLGLVDPLLEGREVVLGVGVLDVGEQLSALSDEEGAPAHEVAGSPLVAGVDIGVVEVAAAQQGGDRVGVASIVFDLSAMDGFHAEGMAEDERDALFGAQVSDPVPTEETLDGDDEVFAVRSQGPKELVSVTVELLMDQGLTGLIKNADVHVASMEVNPAVVTVLLGVESHRGLLSLSSSPRAYRRLGGRGPQLVSWASTGRHRWRGAARLGPERWAANAEIAFMGMFI